MKLTINASLSTFLLFFKATSAFAIPDSTGVGIPSPMIAQDVFMDLDNGLVKTEEEIDVDDLGLSKRNAAPKTSTTGTALQKQMLAYHNNYRAHHSAGNMTWSSTLASAALVSAQKCVFAHTSPYKYGENIAGGSAGYNNPAYFVYLWYNEVVSYNFSSPGYTDATGHFTQVVWKGSTTLGCAWVTGCTGTGSVPNMLFCEYSPNGNVLPNSNFATNVGKPLKTPALTAVPPQST